VPAYCRVSHIFLDTRYSVRQFGLKEYLYLWEFLVL